MSEITSDIETIPNQQEGYRDSIIITPPGNYKKQETIDKWMTEEGEQAKEDIYRRTALDGLYGEICCLSYALDDREPVSFVRTDTVSEEDVLREFFESLKGVRLTRWIGHYISGFDLRFIYKRCVVNNIAPSIKIPYNEAPWSDLIFDTCIEWNGVKGSGAGSLDAVSKGLGYEGKGDLDGSKVWDYFQAGRYDEIREYCEDDVRKARMLYKRMTFQQ